MKKDVKLYNVLFPLWMFMLFPMVWLIVVPGDFIIDSAVLIISMAALKIDERKAFYKKYIFKIFGFGMLSDFMGVGAMLGLMTVFGLGSLGDEWYLTIPGFLISAGAIFVWNYRFTFRPLEKPLRRKLSLIFAVATAPYMFLVPSSWIYG